MLWGVSALILLFCCIVLVVLLALICLFRTSVCGVLVDDVWLIRLPVYCLWLWFVCFDW